MSSANSFLIQSNPQMKQQLVSQASRNEVVNTWLRTSLDQTPNDGNTHERIEGFGDVNHSTGIVSTDPIFDNDSNEDQEYFDPTATALSEDEFLSANADSLSQASSLRSFDFRSASASNPSSAPLNSRKQESQGWEADAELSTPEASRRFDDPQEPSQSRRRGSADRLRRRMFGGHMKDKTSSKNTSTEVVEPPLELPAKAESKGALEGKKETWFPPPRQRRSHSKSDASESLSPDAKRKASRGSRRKKKQQLKEKNSIEGKSQPEDAAISGKSSLSVLSLQSRGKENEESSSFETLRSSSGLKTSALSTTVTEDDGLQAGKVKEESKKKKKNVPSRWRMSRLWRRHRKAGSGKTVDSSTAPAAASDHGGSEEVETVEKDCEQQPEQLTRSKSLPQSDVSKQLPTVVSQEDVMEESYVTAEGDASDDGGEVVEKEESKDESGSFCFPGHKRGHSGAKEGHSKLTSPSKGGSQKKLLVRPPPGSQVPVCSLVNPFPNCWSITPASAFKIRGKNYMRDKVKVFALDCPAYEPIGMDVFSQSTKLHHAAEHLDLTNQKILPGISCIPGRLIVNFQIPLYSPPFLTNLDSDGEGVSLVMHLKLNDKFAKEAPPEAKTLLERFMANESEVVKGRFGLGESSVSLRDRLKLIVRLVSWGDGEYGAAEQRLLNSWNEKPVLTRPEHYFHEGKGYLEIDLDIHRYSYICRRGLFSLQERFKTCTYDVALVIQGNETSELPEFVLACARVNKLDFSKCDTLVTLGT